MCNACGFQCCASDEMYGCGCWTCSDPGCYSLEIEEANQYDDDYGDESTE